MTRRNNLNKPHRSKPDAVSSSTVLQQAMLVAPGVLLALSALFSSSAIGSSGIYPTGTTCYDPSKTYYSFMLFSGGDSIAT